MALCVAEAIQRPQRSQDRQRQLCGQSGASIDQSVLDAIEEAEDSALFICAAMGGIELTTGKPFIFFDSPYTENTYRAIDLSNVTHLSIAVGFGSSSVFLSSSDSRTGESLFYKDNIAYPVPWYWNGTEKAAFMYYGRRGIRERTHST